MPTPITNIFEDGNADHVTANTSFEDAGCTSPALAAGDWFVVGLANYRQEGNDVDGFAPEVEARLGTTRIALGGWRVLFGDFNVGDANGSFMATCAVVTGNGSDTLNYRVRVDNGDGSTQEVRFGGASWMAWSLDALVLNTDYWLAQAANSDTAEVTATGSTWVEGSTSGQLTFTPTESGDYLICASAEGFCQVDAPASQEAGRFRLRMTTDVGGTPTTATIGNEQESQQELQATESTQFQIPMAQWDVRSLTAGITYEIFWEFSNAAPGSEMGYRRSRVIAFRLAAFVNYSFVTYYDGFQASSGTTEATTALTYDFGTGVDVAHFASCSNQNAGSFGEGLFRHDGVPTDYPDVGRMYVPNNLGTGATNDVLLLAFDALINVSGSQTWRLAGTADTAPILTFGRNQGDTADTRSVVVALQMDAATADPQIVVPGSANWIWSANDPSVDVGGVSDVPPSSSWLWSANDPIVASPTSITPPSASWLWSANDPTASAGTIVVTPLSASWLWTATTPTVSSGALVVTPGASSWLWSANDPTVDSVVVVAPDSSSWLWSANDPAVSAGAIVVTPGSADWLWTAATPTVTSGGLVVTPGSASWLWMANDPAVDAGALVITPASASWLWTANDPTVSAGGNVSPPPADWLWNANDPVVTAGTLVVTPPSASWLWSANDPTVDAGTLVVTPGSADWLWSSNDPTVDTGDVAPIVVSASWLWTATTPTVTTSGPQVIVPPSAPWIWTANDPTVLAPVPPVPPIPPGPPVSPPGGGGGGGFGAYWEILAWAQIQAARMQEAADRRALQDAVDDAIDELAPIEATPAEDAAFKLAETMTADDLRRLAIRLASRTRGVK